jgi:N6-adenosine-specific RNA methylase IME4
MSGKYRTIVADPPWPYVGTSGINRGARAGQRAPMLAYNTMTLAEISSLSPDAQADAHLFLWTTSRFVTDAYVVARAWGFRPSQLLVWAKEPVGSGPGGVFASTAEFILYARRGAPPAERVSRSWWVWPRGRHSAKPDAFLDMIERHFPGPYLELFARRARFGWDYYGDESLGTAEMPGAAALEAKLNV